MAISRAQLEQQIQNLSGGGEAELKAPLPSIDPSVQAALDVDLSKNREKFGIWDLMSLFFCINIVCSSF